MTVGPAADGIAYGTATVAQLSTDADRVFVETSDTTGNLADLPFHLIVFCAR